MRGPTGLGHVLVGPHPVDGTRFRQRRDRNVIESGLPARRTDLLRGLSALRRVIYQRSDVNHPDTGELVEVHPNN